MKAFVEGVAYFKRNKGDSIRILIKKMHIEKGKVERSYHLYASQYIENVPEPSVNGAKTVLNFSSRIFPKRKPPIRTRSSTIA
jgi:predicted SnoaL-like aldol condensation-catalyzing enzyme